MRLIVIWSIFFFSFCTNVVTGQVINAKSLQSEEILSLNNSLSEYQIVELNQKQLKSITKAENGPFTMVLRIDGINQWTMDLNPSNVFSSDTKISIQSATGNVELKQGDILTYHGSLAEVAKSKIALTISDDYFSAFISDGEEMQSIMPLSNFKIGSPKNKYIIYTSDALLPNQSYICKAEVDKIKWKNKSSDEDNKGALACKELELAIAVDYQMYIDEGSSIVNVLTSLADVYNLVSLDYDDEFNDQLHVKLKEVLISTCYDCDQWTRSTDVYDVLGSIQSFGNSNGFNTSFDIGILWSTRGYDDNFAGLAFTAAVCNTFSYIAVNKFSSHPQSLRAMMTHEIGHVLGCGHNYEYGESCANNLSRPKLIMDPVVDPSVIGWSDGSLPCSQNSIDTINTYLLAATCLTACEAAVCEPITDLSVVSIDQNGINVNWSGSAGQYDVKIREQGSSQYLVNTSTSNASLNSNVNLEYCKFYDVSVVADCSGSLPSQAVTLTTEIPDGARFKILSVEPEFCDGAYYNLLIVFDFENQATGGFRAEVNGAGQTFQYTSSPQTIRLDGLQSTGNENSTLVLYGLSNSDSDCNAYFSFAAPGTDCVLQMKEDFNNCELPFEWRALTTNAGNNYEWQFGDDERLINNYDNSFNGQTNKSINGSCAAYFDDDLYMGTNYTGMITLETKPYNVSNMSSVNMELIYNYHNFEDGKPPNNSRFQIDVYDGSQWHNILVDDNDSCPFYNVWQNTCMTYFTYDVTSYINSEFKARFVYTDGGLGEWTGMVMLDEFVLSGAQLPALDLQILDFNAVLESHRIDLDWMINTNLEIDYYEVERSADGMSFERLTRIDKEETINYSDLNPSLGSNFYRLRAVSKNGIKSHSNIVEVNYEPESFINIYPNPVDVNAVNVINTTGFDYTSLYMYASDGSLVLQKALPESNHFPIDITGLKEGLYIVQLHSATKTEVLRLIRL